MNRGVGRIRHLTTRGISYGCTMTLSYNATTLRLTIGLTSIGPNSGIFYASVAFTTAIGPIICRGTRPIFVSTRCSA